MYCIMYLIVIYSMYACWISMGSMPILYYIVVFCCSSQSNWLPFYSKQVSNPRPWRTSQAHERSFDVTKMPGTSRCCVAREPGELLCGGWCHCVLVAFWCRWKTAATIGDNLNNSLFQVWQILRDSPKDGLVFHVFFDPWILLQSLLQWNPLKSGRFENTRGVIDLDWHP